MKPSPEIEALVRRYLSGVDDETAFNLLSTSSDFLGIGTDADEWWVGRNELSEVSKEQSRELTGVREGFSSPHLQLSHLRAFEDGRVGWAAARSAMATLGDPVLMRSTFVLLLEAGTWRIIQMHNSIGVPNEDLYGFELTTSLDALVSSLDGEGDRGDAADVSAGTATVMFTDIADSTQISQAIGDERWSAVLRSHFDALRRIVEAEGGTVVKTLGDGGMYTFASARGGLSAAVKIQRAVATASPVVDFSVRVGLHSGDVLHAEGDYFGLTVNKAARIAAAAEGGEIMASAVTAELAGDHGFEFGEPMAVSLKGLDGTHRIVPLIWELE